MAELETTSMQLKLIMQLSLHLKLRLGLKLTLKRTLWIALDQKSSKPTSKVQAETKSFFKYHCHSQVLAYSEAKVAHQAWVQSPAPNLSQRALSKTNSKKHSSPTLPCAGELGDKAEQNWCGQRLGIDRANVQLLNRGDW